MRSVEGGPRRPTQTFLERDREALLNGAFIWRSAAPTDNRGMAADCPPAPRARRAVQAGLLLLALMQGAAWAGGKGDHDHARAAVLAGEVLALPALLERLQRSHPGQVLELELEREDGRWIYEVKLLQAGGQLLKLDVDAATAQVLAVKRRGLGAGGSR